MTFDEACELVSEAVRARGLVVDRSEGLEDDAGFVISYGKREWIEKGDIGALSLDLPAALVEKKARRVRFVNYLDNAARIDAMSPTP